MKFSRAGETLLYLSLSTQSLFLQVNSLSTCLLWPRRIFSPGLPQDRGLGSVIDYKSMAMETATFSDFSSQRDIVPEIALNAANATLKKGLNVVSSVQEDWKKVSKKTNGGKGGKKELGCR
jgi:hypothetical protein